MVLWFGLLLEHLNRYERSSQYLSEWATVSDALRNEHRSASTRYEFIDRAGVLDTDDVGRTVHSDSVITEISPPENRPRAVSEQIAAGGDDRLPGDHGGHLQATSNGGSPFGLNVVAQDGRAVNQGAFARVENDVRRLLQADPAVPVRMCTEVLYSPSSLRPEAFRVTWGRLGDNLSRYSSRMTGRASVFRGRRYVEFHPRRSRCSEPRGSANSS